MTGHVLMPSMTHVGISLSHPLTFSSASLASSQAGVDPTVHLLGFCTWAAKCGWRKSTESCEWLLTTGKCVFGNITKALLLPDSPPPPPPGHFLLCFTLSGPNFFHHPLMLPFSLPLPQKLTSTLWTEVVNMSTFLSTFQHL